MKNKDSILIVDDNISLCKSMSFILKRKGYDVTIAKDGHEAIETLLPAVITVVKEINVPRLPSLRGLAKAKNTAIPIWTATELGVDENTVGLPGSATKVIKVFFPQRVHRGEILQGELGSQVESLLNNLREIKVI